MQQPVGAKLIHGSPLPLSLIKKNKYLPIKVKMTQLFSKYLGIQV